MVVFESVSVLVKDKRQHQQRDGQDERFDQQKSVSYSLPIRIQWIHFDETFLSAYAKTFHARWGKAVCLVAAAFLQVGLTRGDVRPDNLLEGYPGADDGRHSPHAWDCFGSG
jgi:hypothetical protein